MNSFLSIAYPVIVSGIIMVLMIMKNMKRLDDKKDSIMVVSFSILLLWIIGLITKIELVNPIYFGENGGTISFLGIILLLITSVVISYIMDFFRKRKSKAV